MGLDHPHTKAGVGEFGVAISGGVWVAIRVALTSRRQLTEFGNKLATRVLRLISLFSRSTPLVVHWQ